MLVSTYKQKLGNMTEEASIFKVLSDDTRLRVLNVLLTTNASLCVCEITDALQVPQYQVSKHLFLLRSMGLVSAERSGTWVYYSLSTARERNKRLFAFLRGYLNEGLFAADRDGILKRLRRREGGKCVIGFGPANRLRKPELAKTK
jgi:ArsR family transcriptional regulator